MSINLAADDATVSLHPDLYWSDEHGWHPVEQSVQRAITGALIVSVAARIAGRPITLEPEDDDSAWMQLAEVEVLRNWAAVPGKVLTLTLRGASRSVMFRHQDGGFEARPVIHYNDADVTDYYRCVVRLMEI